MLEILTFIIAHIYGQRYDVALVASKNALFLHRKNDISQLTCLFFYKNHIIFFYYFYTCIRLHVMLFNLITLLTLK